MSAHGLGPHPDASLPLFVYGAFRPGELAHKLLAPHLAGPTLNATATDHRLRLRDGLPLLASSQGSSAEGDLLPLAEAGYTVVAEYEPRSLYRWEVIGVRADGVECRANALLGRSPGKGSQDEPIPEWRGHDDPLFGQCLAALGDYALPLVRRRDLGAPSEAAFWKNFVLLEGLYLTLWTVAERVSALCFGPNLDSMQRIKALDAWPEARVALTDARPPARRIYDSRNPSKHVDLGKPGKAFDAWYTTRSNLSHRGKAAMVDGDIVRDSLIGLHDTLRLLLLSELPGLERIWVEWSTQSSETLQAPWLLGAARRKDTHE